MTSPTPAEAFLAFLNAQVPNGGKNKSPEELLRLWRDEYNATVADIRRGMEEFEAGGGRPFREVEEELRRKHNIPRRV
jgi:hypothetical protein